MAMGMAVDFQINVLSLTSPIGLKLYPTLAGWLAIALVVNSLAWSEVQGQDCNLNVVPDPEDIARGDSPDCDSWPRRPPRPGK